MSTLASVPAATSAPLPNLLALVVAKLQTWPEYRGRRFALVGYDDDGRTWMQIPCPDAADAAGREAEPCGGLDGLVSCVKRHVKGVYADADHVLLMVHRPGVEPTQIPIRL